MDFSVFYLGRRFIYRAGDFFHHWYVDGSRVIGRRFMATITSADQSLAVAITMRHFFEPLYKDYSVIGRILGVVFRSGRILMGVIAYFFITVLFAAAYVLWLAIPAVILFYAAKHL